MLSEERGESNRECRYKMDVVNVDVVHVRSRAVRLCVGQFWQR